MSTPEDLYQNLAELLLKREDNQVLEIEILSPGLGPLLHDGAFIGITKKALVQAFLIARCIFFGKLVHLDGRALFTATRKCSDNGHTLPDTEEGHGDHHTVAAEIILLFDCEHLTVCNWRKRQLTATIQHGDDAHVRQLLERELSLMTTYLCSPLHRHTKSPTLWQHRLWVMTQMMKLQHVSQGSTLEKKQTKDLVSTIEERQRLILAELAIVLRAGELHPKNYYAFSYMRQLYSAAVQSTIPGSAFSPLAKCQINPTLKWCLAHLRDISGWTFLFHLLDAIGSTDDQGYVISEQQNVVGRVLRFAVHIGAWEGESLWTFVDLTSRRFGPTVLPTALSACWDDGLNRGSVLNNDDGGRERQGRLINDTLSPDK